MWLCVAFGLVCLGGSGPLFGVALAFGILSWMIKEGKIGSSDQP